MSNFFRKLLVIGLLLLVLLLATACEEPEAEATPVSSGQSVELYLVGPLPTPTLVPVQDTPTAPAPAPSEVVGLISVPLNEYGKADTYAMCGTQPPPTPANFGEFAAQALAGVLDPEPVVKVTISGGCDCYPDMPFLYGFTDGLKGQTTDWAKDLLEWDGLADPHKCKRVTATVCGQTVFDKANPTSADVSALLSAVVQELHRLP